MPRNVDRRDFLKTTAATTAAVGLSAATYQRVYGANDRLGVAFVGVGGRCQMHVDVILAMQKENKGVVPFAVCDVWDGSMVKGKPKGLYPTAERCGRFLERVQCFLEAFGRDVEPAHSRLIAAVHLRP